MDIEISQNGSCLIAALSGELDQHMADAIRGRMDYGLLQAGIKNMVFDFTEVSFMDSSGIGFVSFNKIIWFREDCFIKR